MALRCLAGLFIVGCLLSFLLGLGIGYWISLVIALLGVAFWFVGGC